MYSGNFHKFCLWLLIFAYEKSSDHLFFLRFVQCIRWGIFLSDLVSHNTLTCTKVYSRAHVIYQWCKCGTNVARPQKVNQCHEASKVNHRSLDRTARDFTACWMPSGLERLPQSTCVNDGIVGIVVIWTHSTLIALITSLRDMVQPWSLRKIFLQVVSKIN